MGLPTLRPGHRLGAFEILEELGRGAQAVVYRAREGESAEEVALKWLDADQEWSLRREFRLARSVSHPNLVRLRELHQGPDGVFFTMDVVAGPDILRRCRQAGPVGSPKRLELTRRLFGQLADALGYLHAAAFIHRDLKPGNVLVDRGDRLVLLDFGLSRRVSSPQAWRGGTSGTLAYVAPERFRGAPASPGSDWFSFGVLLVEALTDALPGGTATQTIASSFAGRPLTHWLDALPATAADLRPLVESLLDPSPHRRPSTEVVVSSLGFRPTWMLPQARIDRTSERARIETFVTRRTGAPGMCAIVGESGIGKTTLLREITDDLRRRGYLVMCSRCHPREHVAFNALDGAIVDLLEHIQSLGEKASTPIEPDLELLRRTFSPDATTEPGTTPTEVVEALTRILARMAPHHPAVLWIDDAQWIDDDSLPLLERLVSRSRGSVVMLVTARSTLEDVPEPLRSRVSGSIELLRVSPEQSREFVRRLLPDASATAIEAIVDAASGHPLWLEQLARLERNAPSMSRPRSLTDALLARVADRPGPHRALLSALAVHTGRLPRGVVAACKGLSPSSAYDLLDAGLVRFSPLEESFGLSLWHESIGEAVRASMDEAQLTAEHDRLATAYLEARPSDFEPLFQHLVGAGRIQEALEVGLRSARRLRDGLAFRRAAQRLRWLMQHAPNREQANTFRAELAEVLARSGSALDAGETYVVLACDAAGRRRLELIRMAAEQFLRAGEVERGRALLRTCLDEVQISMPTSLPVRVAHLLARRVRVRLRPVKPAKRRRVTAALDQRIEVAWSAGLGLNLVDVISSALAQAHFTDLALRHGNDEQVGRALAVEYSYAMHGGGWRSDRRGARLRDALKSVLEDTEDPYTRSMIELSWGAGDYFRGRHRLALPRLRSAQAGFSTRLGARSWEIANCGMYETWALLELGELSAFSERVRTLLRKAEARGDDLYRQCFVAGHGAIAWLMSGESDFLLEELDELYGRVDPGRFEMPQYFHLLARARAHLYNGEDNAACESVRLMWPRIRRSGFLTLRYSRLTLMLLAAQTALASDDERYATRFAGDLIRRIGRIHHPAANGWQQVLRAGLLDRQGANQSLIVSSLRQGARALDRNGYRLAAMAVRHRLAELGHGSEPEWPTEIESPERLIVALGVPRITATG